MWTKFWYFLCFLRTINNIPAIIGLIAIICSPPGSIWWFLGAINNFIHLILCFVCGKGNPFRTDWTPPFRTKTTNV